MKKTSKPSENKQLPGAFELFKPSSLAVRRNLTTILLLALLPSLILTFPILILSGHNNHESISPATTIASLLAGAITIAWLLISAVGLQYALLKSAQGESISYGESFEAGLRYFWRMMGLAICVGVLVLVGFILLIVPGIFMIRRYLLSPYYLIDRDLGVSQTMSICSADAKRFSRAIWGVLGINVLFYIPSFIPFIGSLITTVLGILYYCAPALRYEQIKSIGNPGSAKIPTEL